MDSAVGGPGLRRGRRHPIDLRPGESLDFWRVRSVEVGRELTLQAEMRVPGQAWLSWSIDEVDGDDDDGGDGEAPVIALHQVATFAPRGLWGRVYWYAMFPFHWMIFAGMARAITRRAESA
jgi:hypothetical protein